jgi:hypothetical protein
VLLALGDGERLRERLGLQAAFGEQHLDEFQMPAARADSERVVFALRAPVEQRFDDLGVPFLRRPDDRRRAVESVFDVRVGLAFEQEFDHFQMPFVGGVRKRGRAVAKFRIHVHALIKQGFDRRRVATARGLEQLVAQILRGDDVERSE